MSLACSATPPSATGTSASPPPSPAATTARTSPHRSSALTRRRSTAPLPSPPPPRMRTRRDVDLQVAADEPRSRTWCRPRPHPPPRSPARNRARQPITLTVADNHTPTCRTDRRAQREVRQRALWQRHRRAWRDLRPAGSGNLQRQLSGVPEPTLHQLRAGRNDRRRLRRNLGARPGTSGAFGCDSLASTLDARTASRCCSASAAPPVGTPSTRRRPTMARRRLTRSLRRIRTPASAETRHF